MVEQYLLAVTQALESCAYASCAVLIADVPWDGEAPPCGEHQVTHLHKAGAGLLGWAQAGHQAQTRPQTHHCLLHM